MTATVRTRGYRLALLPQPDLVARPSAVRARGPRRPQLWADAAAVGTSTVLASWGVPDGPPTAGIAVLCSTAGWLGLLALLRLRAVELPRLRPAAGPLAAAVAAGLVLGVSAGAAELLGSLRLLVCAGAGTVLSLGARVLLRRRLHQRRRRGRELSRVLLVGHAEPAARAIETLAAGRRHGYVAVAACLPSDGVRVSAAEGIPGCAEVGEVLEIADELAVDAVALVSDLDLSGAAAGRLAAGLGDRAIPFLAVRGTQVATTASSWARVRPVPGLPFVRITGHRRMVTESSPGRDLTGSSNQS